MIPTINDRRYAYRAPNLRTVIAALKVRELSRDDICVLLSLSRSAVRSYVVILAPLLETRQSAHDAQCTYRLTSDERRVEAFLANLGNAPARRKTEGAGRSKLAAALCDPSRHFHILADDEFHAVKVHRASVMPDPWALPRPFFRSVGAGVAAQAHQDRRGTKPAAMRVHGLKPH